MKGVPNIVIPTVALMMEELPFLADYDSESEKGKYRRLDTPHSQPTVR